MLPKAKIRVKMILREFDIQHQRKKLLLKKGNDIELFFKLKHHIKQDPQQKKINKTTLSPSTFEGFLHQ